MITRRNAGGSALGLLALGVCLGVPGWSCSPSAPMTVHEVPVEELIADSVETAAVDAQEAAVEVTAATEATVAALAEPDAYHLKDRDPALRARTQPGIWQRNDVMAFRTALDREGERDLSLQARAERRAFDGAPPVMPHSAIFGQGTKTCVECHTEGMTLGKRVAHPMSHPPFSSCLQCHVETSNRQFEPQADVPTSFAGMQSPGPGVRQSALAPPQMPHGIAMRGQCLSCHGEFGYDGLRTTHPQRASCVQCHAVQPRLP